MRRLSITQRLRQWLLFAALTTVSVNAIQAQNVPVISGGVGFFTNNNGSQTNYQPAVAPLIALPLGPHLLIESRGDIREIGTQATPSTANSHQFIASLVYLQLDYIANRYITIVGGKFITPFGTYNERLTPIWIPNFQDAPLLYGIGTRMNGASDGAMVRGAAFSNDHAQLNYAAYFSGSTQTTDFKAARNAGMQLSAYFPTHRLEIGTSYQRFRQQVHNDSVGVHVWWMPPRTAFELRSEYAHGANSQGYWIELAYRLSQFGGTRSLVGRFEPAFRMQQTFRNHVNFSGQSDGLPSVDTQQIDFGFDYHVTSEVRFNSSYSRSFTATANKNLWDLSLTYRFLFPTWRGRK
jgi:hypothetical protein